MNKINFDPNGGDLGRAFSHVTPLEFETVIPHIANILYNLHHSKISRLPFYYAFEFSGHNKKQIELVMNSIKLAPNTFFYQTDGKSIFEIRGPSGGVVTSMICYLVTHD